MPGKAAKWVLTQTQRRAKPHLPSRWSLPPRQEAAVGQPHQRLPGEGGRHRQQRRRGKASLRKRRRTRASQGGVFLRLGRLRPSLKDLPSHPRPLEDPTPRDARWISTPPPSPSRPPKPAKTGRRRRLGLAIKLHRKGNARRPTALEWIQARRR